MLSTGGMLRYANEHAGQRGTAIVATETGMLHPLRQAAPEMRVHRRQRGRPLPLHEDDHAAEAARRDSRRRRRGQGAAPRSPSGREYRSSGWSRSARSAGGGQGEQVEAVLGRLAHCSQRHALALELGAACSSGRRRRVAHLESVPQRAGLVDPLEPRHPVERLGDEHDDVFGAALALRGRAALVGDAGATEQRQRRSASGRDTRARYR